MKGIRYEGEDNMGRRYGIIRRKSAMNFTTGEKILVIGYIIAAIVTIVFALIKVNPAGFGFN